MESSSYTRSVKENLEDFWSAVRAAGWNAAALLESAEELLGHGGAPSGNASVLTKNVTGIPERANTQKHAFSPLQLKELRDLSAATGIDLPQLVCFNRYAGILMPEECTVYFAAGRAGKNGWTVFGKNSDKTGDKAFDSELYYKNRQINVIHWYDNPDGSHIIGVAAAGSTGLKMGLNSYGVAVGTNYGETVLAQKKSLSVDQKMAGDRAQIAREALTEKTALAAAQKAAAYVLEHPMASSGLLEFADPNEVIVMESAYDYVALKRIRDEVDSRANFFNILPQLNRPGNISSFCRYHRSQNLLKSIEGGVSAEDLIRISMDHANGPGANSICRHTHSMESATLAAAVMELNGDHPEQSLIHIALGTPCRAWTSPEGHLTLSMSDPIEAIPEGFRNGDVFRKFCLNEPKPD